MVIRITLTDRLVADNPYWSFGGRVTVIDRLVVKITLFIDLSSFLSPQRVTDCLQPYPHRLIDGN